MSVRFCPRIHWPNNPLLLPASLFGISVPSGINGIHVRSPNYVDVPRMQQALRSGVRSPGRGLGIVNGLVTADIRVCFADITRQWRRLPAAGGQSATHGPCQFQFSGGEVFLDLTFGIYILNTCKPVARDPISVQIFALVYEHELLHVLDEINVLKNWLPSRVTSESMVSRYLVNANPFTYGTPRQRIAQVEENFRNHIQSRLQGGISAMWAREHNRRTGRRDAPSEYRIVQQQIDTLRARQANR
jgi:hypothetical protein